MKFYPEVLSVCKGDTVIFLNNDMVVHDVTEENKKLWTSGPLPEDSSWRMVVTDPADYYCSIHVVMKGKLLVK
jgi:plastocyanin